MTDRITHSEELSLTNRLVKEIEASHGFSTCSLKPPGNGKAGGAGLYDNRNNLSHLKVMIPAIGALAGFAARGLKPSRLSGTREAELVNRLSGDVFGRPSPPADDSELARSAAESLFSLSLTADDTSPPWTDRVVEALRKFHSGGERQRQLLLDPLLPGWMHQVLARRQQSIDSSANLDIKRRTQWFTPTWVSSFLAEESITREGDIFLDPAAGAGHILVSALKRLFELSTRETPAQRVRSILKTQLAGLDIDPQMTALSTLAIYMASRDLSPSADLPAPLLFSIENRSGDELLGSLWLGVEGGEQKLSFRSFGAGVALPSSFTALATNPPFLSHRNMPDFMATFLKKYYPSSRYDLYAAFIELVMRLVMPGGSASMICQQSFLSIQRYHELRSKLFEGMNVQSIVQLGPGTFAAKQGEKANNAIITLKKSLATQSDPPTMMSARILSRAEKIQAEERGIRSLLRPQAHPVNTMIASISRAPVAFWCPDEIASLFSRYPKMESEGTGIVLTNGLFTCNNALFVRHVSQVNESERRDYVPYDKGGGHKWFRTTPLLLRWTDNGENIRQYRKERGQSRSLPGENYYFKPGLTYSYIGTRGFKARLLSPASIFDIASSAVFSSHYDLFYVLGFLNSALARFMLGVLNPTINFQIGDLRRLPFLLPSAELESRIVTLSRSCVDLATEYDARPDLHSERLRAMNNQEHEHQKSIDNLVFDAYGISSFARQRIKDDPWVSRSQGPAFQPSNRRL